MLNGELVLGMFKKLERQSLSFAVALIATTLPHFAFGQQIDRFFSSAVPGFDRDAGVTVSSRLRQLYDEPTVRLGSFRLTPRLDETIGFDSNVNAISRGSSSPFVQTSPSITATSDWSRNRIGFQFGLDNQRYISIRNQNYTNFNAGVGGGLTFGREVLNLGYTHLEQHEQGTSFGAAASSTPIAYNVDVIRSDFAIERGRFKFIPTLDVRHYKFSNATIQGIIVSQAGADRAVYTGDLTTRYEFSQQRALLLAFQETTSQYDQTSQSLPIRNSETAIVLTGIDYQTTGPWRYRVLAGGEFRHYQSLVYADHIAPIAQADVIWTPTGLTTISGSVRREIEDSQSEATSGFNYTKASLTVDHELRRNLLLQARGSFQAADYFDGGGSSTAYTAGAGVTWLLNRRLRLTADYDYIHQVGTNGTAFVGTSSLMSPLAPTEQLNTLTTGNYTRNILMFGVHIGL